MHDPEGRNGGQREGDCRNQGRTPVSQEKEDDDDGEDRTFHQRVQRRLVIAIGEIDRVIDHLDRDIGMRLADAVQAFGNGFRHRDFACTLGAEDGEGDRRRAVEAREGFLLLIGIGHPPEF
ncbi:hypothetical protein D3C80_642470 [compost metagenome]